MEFIVSFCPGFFNVWYLNTAADEWTPILHVDSWNLAENVEEAPRKRTSSTNGQSVKFCSDIVGYDMEVVSTLNDQQWLFSQILHDERVLANGITTWWFLSWAQLYSTASTAAIAAGVAPFTGLTTGPVATGPTELLGDDGSFWPTTVAGSNAPSYTNAGVICYGTVRPPSFGGDNTANDVGTASFTINTQVGPFLPTQP